jgi:7-carboxy-7-deazaguanine synthase
VREPEGSTRIVATRGQELKLVYPQAENRPEQFRDLQFDHFFLQPKDGPDRQANTELVIRYCMTDPRWRMAVQTHKMIGVR